MRRIQLAAASGAALTMVAAVNLGGCAAKDISAMKSEVENLEQHVGALLVEVDRRINTAGGDVNEPVMGWILAVGYALVPVSFLGYLVAHRSRFFRAFMNRVRGGSSDAVFLSGGHAPRP